MEKIKKALDDLMIRIKKENPNASWSNLLTGVVILVILAIFSFWYFGQNVNTNVDEGSSNDSKTEDTNGAKVDDKTGKTSVEGVAVNGQGVTVQQGEGLWQVALRVCGDGEKYNSIAEQNGLSIWAQLTEGMNLKVSCN